MSLKDCMIGPAAPVSDLDRAREFYEGTLSLQPDGTPGESMVGYARWRNRPHGARLGLCRTDKATLA